MVFGDLADFESLPRWNYAIAATRKLDAGPVTVGARYAQIRTIPTRSEEAFEVIEFEPDRRLVLAASLSVHEPAGFGGDASAGLCGDGLSR